MKYKHCTFAKIAAYPLACSALVCLALSPLTASAAGSMDSESANVGTGSSYQSNQTTNALQAKSKDETVYVYTNPDGSVKRAEVSAKLGVPEGADEVVDATNLTDIVPDEDSNATYTGTGESVVWATGGKDVTYRGSTSVTAPVDVSVSYTLDGASIDPADLAGKTGHVVIRYDYANNSSVTVDVDGQSETVTTPFMAVTAVLLDSEVFENIQVTNAKIIEDGDRTVVVGYAMPGLSESLDISDGDFNIPEYVEIEADVTDFELKSALTLVSPNLFDDMDLDFDTAELSDTSAALKEAMSALSKGSNELTDGLRDLADGVRQANSASGAITSGMAELEEAAESLAAGATSASAATEALPESASQLAAGSQAVASELTQIHGGVQLVDDGLKGVITGEEKEIGGVKLKISGLEDLPKTASELEAASKALCDLLEVKLPAESGNSVSGQSEAVTVSSQAIADATANVDQQLKTITGQASSLSESASAVQSATSNAQTALSSIDLSSIEDEQVRTAIQNQINTASSEIGSVSASADSLATQASALAADASAIDVTTLDGAAQRLQDDANSAAKVVPQDALDGDELDNAREIAKNIYENSKIINQSIPDVAKTVIEIEHELISKKLLSESALPAAEDGASRVAAGAATLQAEAPKLRDGVNELAVGANQMSSAITQATSGIQAFNQGMNALTEGASAAADGSAQLSEGVQQFNDEGISKLTDMIDNQLLKFVKRYDAVVQAGRDYTNFSGISEGTTGTVKFVYETDAITAE